MPIEPLRIMGYNSENCRTLAWNRFLGCSRTPVGAASAPAFYGCLCACGRSVSGRLANTAGCGRSAGQDRRTGAKAGCGDPGPHRRAGRDRGLSARLFLVEPGGAGADGAGRSAAAGARRRHRGRPDRGQARRAGLVASGRPGRLAARFRVRLDAGRHRPADPSGRDSGDHSRRPCETHRLAGRAHGGPPGDAAARLAFRARPDDRGSAVPRRRRRHVPLFLRHARRGSAHAGRRGTLLAGLCGCHRCHRRTGRRRRAARSAGYFGQAVRSASAL